ncbi:hypothetical protein Bca101_056405 [Brassica carinata]
MWHHVIGRWKRRRDGGFGSLAFGKLKSKIEKGELNGDELKHRIEDRSFPNESDDLISSLHLRLLSSTGVSVGVSLQIERLQFPIERSQLRNLNPIPFDFSPVCKLLSSPNPRRIVPILARYGLLSSLQINPTTQSLHSTGFFSLASACLFSSQIDGESAKSWQDSIVLRAN